MIALRESLFTQRVAESCLICLSESRIDRGIRGLRLTKLQAALILGVSPRTVERYVLQGMLKAAYRRGKTRPIATFDPLEVEALRRRFDTGDHPHAVSAPESAAPVFSLRLPPHYRQQLEEQGRPLGLGPGQYARRLIIHALESEVDTGQQTARLSEEISRLSTRLEEARSDIAFLLYALLTRLGDIDDQELRAWFESHMGYDPTTAHGRSPAQPQPHERTEDA